MPTVERDMGPRFEWRPWARLGAAVVRSFGVLVCHRDRLYRESLSRAIGQHPRVEQVWNADSLAAFEGICPDVILIDLELPDRSGLDQARRARDRYADGRVLMTGCSDLEDEVVACVEAGAFGCVPDGASLDELLRHVVAVADGKVLCPPDVVARVFSRLNERASTRRFEVRLLVRLTPREIEILHLLDQSLTNKEIGERLGIRLQTVKNHVHNILDKLKLDSRGEAARYARERGIIRSARLDRDQRSAT